jgi:hypothetical protein
MLSRATSAVGAEILPCSLVMEDDDDDDEVDLMCSLLTDVAVDDVLTDAVKDGNDLADCVEDDDVELEGIEAEVAGGDATGGAFSRFEERDDFDDGGGDDGRTTLRTVAVLAAVLGVEPAEDLRDEVEGFVTLVVRSLLLLVDDFDDLLERALELIDKAIGGAVSGVLTAAFS